MFNNFHLLKPSLVDLYLGMKPFEIWNIFNFLFKVLVRLNQFFVGLGKLLNLEVILLQALSCHSRYALEIAFATTLFQTIITNFPRRVFLTRALRRTLRRRKRTIFGFFPVALTNQFVFEFVGSLSFSDGNLFEFFGQVLELYVAGF